VVVELEKILTTQDLMDQFSNMNKDNSVCQIYIPGKGKFTIVLQEEDQKSIASEVRANPSLKQLINESIEAYHSGDSASTADLLKMLKPEDFEK
jgi:hypothetical protein